MPSTPLPYKKGPLKFPIENQDEFHSKISFQAIQIDTREQLETLITGLKTEATNTKITGGAGNSGSGAQADAQIEQQRQAEGKLIKDQGNNVALGKLNAEFIEGAKVDLYMPVGIQFADRLAYSTPDLGITGAGIQAGAQAGLGLGANIGGAFERLGTGLSDLFNIAIGNLGSLGADAATRAVAGAVNLIPGTTGTAFEIGLRVTASPNTRAAFQNVGLRRFTFDFKFMPTSKEEADEVENIIYMFRHHAYPEQTGDEVGIPYAYRYPDMFKIKLMYNKAQTSGGRQFRPIGQQIKLCYLESINVAYNSTSASYHRDGTPVETNMTLNFLEYRTIHRDDLRYDKLDYDPDLVNAYIKQDTQYYD
jgi:hypothetical protein